MKHFFYLALIFISVNITVDAQDLRNICPDRNHPHAIDLGTGVLWACCNVGASDPLDYGETFEWDGYDVANRRWGSDWRMPTTDEIEKLYDKIVPGIRSWGSDPILIFRDNDNGKQIVLPSENELGLYWSCQKPKNDDDKAYYFGFDFFHNYYHGLQLRYKKSAVRPVKPKPIPKISPEESKRLAEENRQLEIEAKKRRERENSERIRTENLRKEANAKDPIIRALSFTFNSKEKLSGLFKYKRYDFGLGYGIIEIYPTSKLNKLIKTYADIANGSKSEKEHEVFVKEKIIETIPKIFNSIIDFSVTTQKFMANTLLTKEIPLYNRTDTELSSRDLNKLYNNSNSVKLENVILEILCNTNSFAFYFENKIHMNLIRVNDMRNDAFSLKKNRPLYYLEYEVKTIPTHWFVTKGESRSSKDFFSGKKLPYKKIEGVEIETEECPVSELKKWISKLRGQGFIIPSGERKIKDEHPFG